MQPLDDTFEATAAEETAEETAGASSSLQIAIRDIMDMAATDHEGFEVVDGSKDDRVQDNTTELSVGNRTTRKRQQGKEEDETGAK